MHASQDIVVTDPHLTTDGPAPRWIAAGCCAKPGV